MKKTLFTLAIVLLAVAAQAQIKMHSDGQISLGSLTKNYGVQVMQNGLTYFRAQSNESYSITTRGLANNDHQKHWAIKDYYSNGSQGEDLFYVYGNGAACATNHFTITNNSSHAKGSEAIDGEEALSIITGLNGFYYAPEDVEIPDLENNEYVVPEAVEAMYADFSKRSTGLSGSNLEEVFPEAVRTDPQNRLCIDYQAVVTMLVEAVKEQQHEIEELRGILEENGLLK